MAKMVLLASYLNVAGTDLTANTSKIELEIDVNDQDVTTFASGGWKEVLGGLKSAKLAVTFKTDYAAAAVDELIWGLLGTVVTYEVRPSSSARSTSNPGYTGNVLISKWVPISGSPGDVAEVSVDWVPSGAVARQTA
jgi:hypothetical protein